MTTSKIIYTQQDLIDNAPASNYVPYSTSALQSSKIWIIAPHRLTKPTLDQNLISETHDKIATASKAKDIPTFKQLTIELRTIYAEYIAALRGKHTKARYNPYFNCMEPGTNITGYYEIAYTTSLQPLSRIIQSVNYKNINIILTKKDGTPVQFTLKKVVSDLTKQLST